MIARYDTALGPWLVVVIYIAARMRRTGAILCSGSSRREYRGGYPFLEKKTRVIQIVVKVTIKR